MKHQIERNLIKWGSCGKFHNEPMKYRLVRELSDSHLSHIIPWIKKYKAQYSDDTLKLMEDEQTYRCKHYIYVPDYKD